MDQKFSKIFDKKTLELISKYCETNNILDVDKFVFKCFRQGFDIERYGFLGESNQTEVKEVEVIKYVDREVIKEIKVEVPVEKIVYIYDKKTENELDESITKMKEEMSKKDEQLDELRRNLDIFKETPKENTEETKMLQETLQKLRKEINDKNKQIQELEKINKDLTDESSKKIAVYLRGSNINQKI
jgi:uncharacterized coiled-coil DUF342 family protein